MKKVVLGAFLLLASTLSAQDLGTRPRVIIPLAGRVNSAAGLYLTDVRLDGTPGLLIRVIFHPAGAVASDHDPFIKFACGEPRCFAKFFDMVGEIELIYNVNADIDNLVGSLEIIPDETSSVQVVPDAFARILFAKPGLYSTLNFGTVVPAVTDKMIAQLAAAGPQVILVPGTDMNVRRSVGLRTITPITYSVTVIGSLTGAEREVVSHATLPADYTLYTSIDGLLGQHADVTDDVRITIESGTAVGLYTYTHNINGETTLVAPGVAPEFRARVQ